MPALPDSAVPATLASARLRTALPAIAIATFAFVLPLVVLGYGPTHDFAFHVGNWMEVARQWHEGILLPRWAAQANYGYGDPRFIFYPPLSWLMGAALSLVLPWKMVPGAFVAIALMTAGASMFVFAREWMAKRYAILAAVAYVTNPYEVMLVYKRMAAAELLASAIFPLLLLFACRVARLERRAIVPMAAVYAGIWLTNAPSAVIASYSIATLFAAVALSTRRVRPILYGAGALALGMALAAFYIVPAAWEQRWVDISMALTLPHNRPENNFIRLFPPRLPGSIGSIINVGVMNLVLGAVVLAIAVRKRRTLPHSWWWIVALLGVMAAVLTLPPSLPLWEHLPKLLFVQIPWRWLFVVNAAIVLLFAAVLPALRSRTRLIAAIVPALVFVVLMGAYATKGRPGDIGTLESRIAAQAGYMGEAAYLPKGEWHDCASGGDFIRAGGSANVRLIERNARHLVMRSDAATPGTLTLGTAWYPSWRATIDGSEAPLRDADGQLALNVPAGHSEIDIRFASTPDRTLGGILSVIALAVAALLALTNRHQERAQTEVVEEQAVTVS